MTHKMKSHVKLSRKVACTCTWGFVGRYRESEAFVYLASSCCVA